MIFIIGLGNPGKIYARTRHNVGFMMADKLRKVWNFPEFKFDKKFNAEMTEGYIPLSSRANPDLVEGEVEGSRNNTTCVTKNEKVILGKPQTFMNQSGEAVKKIMKFYKLKPSDIIVIHDDLDIDLGKFKISTDSSAAGHQGVQNIIDKIGTQKFTRIRVGIEGAILRKKRKIPGDEFVLKNFSEKEIKVIKKILSEAPALVKEFYKSL